MLKCQKFTNREVEVLKLVVAGQSNKQVAHKLYISHKTVNNHRYNMQLKSNTHNLLGLARYALAKGIIEYTEFIAGPF